MSVRILVGDLSVQGLFGHVLRPHMLGFLAVRKTTRCPEFVVEYSIGAMYIDFGEPSQSGQSITALLDDV